MPTPRFGDRARASVRLEPLGGVSERLIDLVASAADPDTATDALLSLGEVAPDFLEQHPGDDLWLARVVRVLGTSRALGDFWFRHPGFLSDLSAEAMETEQLDERRVRRIMGEATDAASLRIAYHRVLTKIAARDVTAASDFAQTSSAISDLAVATLAAALAIARIEEPDAEMVSLTIMAMGKAGGHELNYVSDVDVIFIHEVLDDADGHRGLQIASRLAASVIRLCGEHMREGTIWEVDPNLRPEGRNGPLTRTLQSHVAYYERWASTWEYQALMKARFAAGDEDLADRYLAALRPMIWEASRRDDFVKDVRAMRARVVDNIPSAQRSRELKLGSGGLRDVEFAVQLLQLVHGRVDTSVRSPNTLEALDVLTRGGYVGRMDGSALADSYVFLRTLEHRIQLFKLQRTHLVPEADEDLRRIGRSMGFVRNPADSLVEEWQAHRRVVSRLHEKIFFRPLLEAVAALPTDGLRLSAEAVEERFRALGYSDPTGAVAHIQALTAGVSRRAAIQRSLLPAMLEWFSESANPDGGLLAFRRISEELGDSPWYLRKLRDEGSGAQQLARLLSSSAYVTDLIVRAPDSVAMLGDEEEFVPRTRELLQAQTERASDRHEATANAVRAIRRIRRRELGRVAMADVLGRLGIDQVGEALSAINAATLAGTLKAVQMDWVRERGPLPTRFTIVLMGRLGGHETGYGSDADLMFVHDPLPEADDSAASSCAVWLAQQLRQHLGVAGDDPPLELDADLRPEGRSGTLVRTFASYRAYYEKWSDTWEAQALLRAEASVGDPDLCARFTDLINPLRYPDEGLSAKEVREIRRIKARVDSERLPRGADPNTHLKLGRGGLADIEWTIQLIQMQHAHEVPALRTTRTLEALNAAADAELLDPDDARVLIEAWLMVTRIRNGAMLWRNKPAESMVVHPTDLAGLAHVLDLGQDNAGEMVNDYLRQTRRARQVVEQVFYGWDE